MATRRKTVDLGLWMNGEAVGTWRVKPSGDQELHYNEAWIASDLGRPISLSMPLRPAEAPYRGEVVRTFFENLLPDNKAIRARLAQRYKTTVDAAHLLQAIGRDCVGALQLLPTGSKPGDLEAALPVPMSEAEIEEHLLKVPTVQHFSGEDAPTDSFRISLAGAQEKTAFTWHQGQWCRPQGATPTTHIFKLPLGQVPGGIDLSTSVYNEWLCMRLLTAFQIPTATTVIGQFGDQQVLVVERFDRKPTTPGNWLRLPQEDFAQVFGIDPVNKYESDGGPGIQPILQQLQGSSNPMEDRQDFFRTQILFWMLAAIDGHAKNFSVFLDARGAYRLTPRYDVLSAYPVMGNKAGFLSSQKIRMAMAIWGKNRHYEWSRIQRRHLEHTGHACHVQDVPLMIDELVARTPDAIDVVAADLPVGFPAKVADTIFAGLKSAAEKLKNAI